MNLSEIRVAKHELEEKAEKMLGELIKEFEEKTSVTVQSVTVSIDTQGTAGSNLQRVYAPLAVSITVEDI